MWPDQPLGRSITGTEKTLDAIGRKQIVESSSSGSNYVAPAYAGGGCGRITHAEAVRAVRNPSENLRRVQRPRYRAGHDFTKRSPPLTSHAETTEQTQAALGIPRLFTARRMALRVAPAQRHPWREHEFAPFPKRFAKSTAWRIPFIQRTASLMTPGTLSFRAGWTLIIWRRLLKLIVREMKPAGAELASSSGIAPRARD